MSFFSKSPDKETDTEKWKNKYLSLLDAQDLAEKSNKVNQDLLCKTIARLSITASGVDQSLEPSLQSIRDLIKREADFSQLKLELEKFNNKVSQLAVREQPSPSGDKSLDLLFAFLLQRYSSDKQQQDLKLLRKDFQDSCDPQKLFSAIFEIIQEDVPNSKPEQPTESITQSTEVLVSITLIRAQLVQLLEKIEIPEGFSGKVQALKQQLENRSLAGSVEAILGDVTSLLIDINAKNQYKQQEIDKFLAHVTEQIAELGLTITDSSIALMDVSLKRSELDDSVSKQINDLQHRSSTATQLEPLKQVISAHIAKISAEIQEHKQKEAEEREKYQRQLDELSQKMKVMETETGELRSKLVTANSNAQRDGLTDLPNRLAYDERLKVEMARWQRYHTPLCLVFWDIDFFKKVNDQYGHQAGDHVLAHVARLFLENIRRADFIARFGGEEFVMLLPHTNRHSALVVAEKLRALIEQNTVTIQDKKLVITVSCGVTQFLKGDTHESAFERADQALYRAKEQGRNRCCIG